MSLDITLCKAGKCPMKFTCHRYENNTVKNYSKKDIKYQSYFLIPPYVLKDKKWDCNFYWGQKSETIINEITNICQTKKKKK